MWHKTRDMWHVTCDTWHVTCDMWHVTHDTWHLTPHTWHLKCDTWHVTCDLWHVTHDFCFTKSDRKVTKNAKKLLKSADKYRKVSKRRDFIVSVLLSAHAERVGVSCMQYFLMWFNKAIVMSKAGKFLWYIAVLNLSKSFQVSETSQVLQRNMIWGINSKRRISNTVLCFFVNLILKLKHQYKYYMTTPLKAYSSMTTCKFGVFTVYEVQCVRGSYQCMTRHSKCHEHREQHLCKFLK